MKKIIVISALLALVIWGVYDISVSKSNPLNIPQSVTDDVENSQVVGLEEGNLAPNFTLPTLEGDKLTLSEYRGQKIILNMWASWCPPCIAEMPDMQEFYTNHQTDGIEILAINMTESEKNIENVSKFIEDFSLTFPIVLDEKSQVADLYQVTTIPTTYILDSKGRIEQKIIGPITYDKMVQMMK